MESAIIPGDVLHLDETEDIQPREDDVSMNDEPKGFSWNGHRIELRDILYGLSLGATVVGLYFISNARLTSLEHKVLENRGKIDNMDDNGTRRSHERDSIQQQQIDFNTQQIGDINRTLRDLGPKVDKIDTNVLWLMTKQAEAARK